MKDDYFTDQLRALGFDKDEARNLFYGVVSPTQENLHEHTTRWMHYIKRIQLERDLISMVGQGDVYVTYDEANDSWTYQLANRQRNFETED